MPAATKQMIRNRSSAVLVANPIFHLRLGPLVASGKRRLTPYWRVIKDDGSLNPKYPGGINSQARNLRAEGFTVARNGKKPPTVKEFERRLYNFK